MERVNYKPEGGAGIRKARRALGLGEASFKI